MAHPARSGHADTGALPRRFPPLDALEVASGSLFGTGPRVALAADPPPFRAALEAALLPALAREPCLVAFSGGRDSSAVLATAVQVARRHGLSDPVPLTARYAQHPLTREDEWQELVVRHLGLSDWRRIDIVDELDAVGPLAQAILSEGGVFWPPNAHAMAPMLREATGGSLLTGNGGDELFSWAGTRMDQLRWALRAKPRRFWLKRATVSMLPRPVREVAWRRRPPIVLPWLTPEGNRLLGRRVARRWAQLDGGGRRAAVENWLSTRYLHVARSAFAVLADRAGVRLVEPFFDPLVAAALAHAAPGGPDSGRTKTLQAQFGDLLPVEVLTRSTKASFTDILWGPGSRAFAEAWDGRGLDPDLVDPELLRAEWRSERPDFRCVTALQAAWLASAGQA